MAVTPDTGYGCVFKLATDTSTTVVTIGALRDFDVSMDMGEADVSHCEDASTWSSFIPTRGGMTISGNVVFDPGSAEHEATLLDQWGYTRNFDLRFNDVTTASDSAWSGSGFITSLTPSGGHDTELSCGFTMRVTGAPTFAGVA